MSRRNAEQTRQELARETLDARLEQITKLLEEMVEDNMAVVAVLKQVQVAQEASGSELERGFADLRRELAGALAYRALKDLCVELIGPLTAMEEMLERADFTDPATIAGHVRSLSVTLRGVLGRMGAEKVTIAVGEELYDPNRHRCVGVIAPDRSPFPNAAPHTVVRVVQDGYLLDRRPLTTPAVEIQSGQANQTTDR